MKYTIDYQYMPSGSSRPIDDGEIVTIEALDTDGHTVIIPNVGDYVYIDNSQDGGERSDFSGKVRSRLFRYIRTSETEVFCHINIVVEETADDFGELVKE